MNKPKWFPSIRPRVWIVPGERLMSRLSMRSKLLLVVSCAIVPMALMAAIQVAEGFNQYRLLQREGEGLRQHQRLLALAGVLDRSRALASDPATAPARAELARGIEQAQRQLESTTAAALREQPAWQELRRQLAATDQPKGPAIDTVRSLMRENAESAELLAARDRLDQARAQMLVHRLPPLADAVAQATDVAVSALAAAASGTVDPILRSQVLTQISRVGVELGAAALEMERLSKAATPPSTWPAAHAAVDLLTTGMMETFSRERPELPPAAAHRDGVAALSQLHDLQAEIAAQQLASVDARELALHRWMASGGLLVALSVLLTGYLLIAMYRAFSRSLASLLRSTHDIAEGDLSSAVVADGADELARIGRTVNGMGEHLSGLVAEIRSSAARVNMAGSQVADGSQRLSQRTEEQASRLRESVESIGQLSQAAQLNAGGARELDSITEQLARKASDGHGAMVETLTAVGQLQDSSRRVFEVVKVIDDVAFQTSMLSLNAAVEAARAGEAGRGFALVASEVRSLAQRVGESADEIRMLITQASDQLETSGTKLGIANGALEDVVSGVHEVSSRLRQIAQASTEQSDTLVSVAQRVGDLDEITRDNARLVDESTFASRSLLERAEVLRDAVASMKLRQGSADEAHALLDRAWAHLQQVGQEQGLKDLHDRSLGFIDRDLYVFALDREGAYIACGAKPEMVGTNVNALPGIRGTPFVAEVWTAAEAGGGWVQYEIANPLTGEVTPKESFVRKLDERLLLGCGIYRRAAKEGSAKPRAAAWSPSLETRQPATLF